MLPPRYWFVVGVVLLAGCGSKPKLVTLPPPTPARVGNAEVGMASWYGHPYHGRRTSNGEIYDMDLLTAAHLSLPFDTWVRVTNLENGRWVDLRINDRGPFVKNRIIDLSRAGARAIHMIGPGTARVSVEVVGMPGRGYDPNRPTTASLTPVSYTPDAPTNGVLPAAAAETPGAASGINDGSSCPSGPFYAVQVGSFREADNAERMRGKMNELYGVSRMVSVETEKGPLYRVVVGQMADQTAAKRLLDRIGRDHFDGYVQRIDPSAASQCL